MATLNKGIANRLAVFERNVLRRRFERIKVNENCRKPYNKELIMFFFLDLDILSCVRISRLNWSCRLNRMDGKRNASEVFNP